MSEKQHIELDEETHLLFERLFAYPEIEIITILNEIGSDYDELLLFIKQNPDLLAHPESKTLLTEIKLLKKKKGHASRRRFINSFTNWIVGSSIENKSLKREIIFTSIAMVMCTIFALFFILLDLIQEREVESSNWTFSILATISLVRFVRLRNVANKQ